MKKYRVIFFQIITLLIVSLVLGGISNQVLPKRIAWIENWNKRIEILARKENIPLVDYDFVLRAISEQSHILLDARSSADYEAGQISGAFSLPASSQLDDQDVFSILLNEDKLLIYCDGVDCDDSLMLALNLRDLGFTNLVIYPGGWSEWVQKETEEL
jgi:3-mercaptopyruvate sulfurtransferase SseA